MPEPTDAKSRLWDERARLTEVLEALREQGVPETRYRAKAPLRRSQAAGGQDRISSPIERVEAALEDVEDALKKIDDGTYGVCEECGGTIIMERLLALPAARTCHPEHHSASMTEVAGGKPPRVRTPADQREFARLSAWRSDVASDFHWSAYAVCQDEVLELLMRRRPGSRDRLRGFPGLNRQVLDLHGDALLGILAQRAGS